MSIRSFKASAKKYRQPSLNAVYVYSVFWNNFLIDVITNAVLTNKMTTLGAKVRCITIALIKKKYIIKIQTLTKQHDS